MAPTHHIHHDPTQEHARHVSERGQILILTAFSMVVLLATAALSIDVAYMYDRRNILHAAADDAAKSGAIERWRSGAADISAFALQAIGHRLNIDPSTITPPPIVRACDDPSATCSTAFQANWHNYVEVILGQDTSTFFGKILGWTTLTPTTRAVAGTSAGVNCLVACPNNNCGGAGVTGVQVGNMGGGGSSISMPTCGLATGGDLFVGNSATVTAGGISVAGICSGPTCPPNTTQGAAPPTDPLANQLTPPPIPPMCTPISVGMNGTLAITAGCYSSINVGNHATLVLGPGIYVVTGTFTTQNNAQVCLNTSCAFDYGNGVLVYLTGMGNIDWANSTTSVLNAQTSGPYNGILFYQDPSDTLAATFRNGMGLYDLSGALYFPNADVQFGNTGSTNDCSLVVAKSLTLGNGGNNFSNACGQFGGSPILTVTLAE